MSVLFELKESEFVIQKGIPCCQLWLNGSFFIFGLSSKPIKTITLKRRKYEENNFINGSSYNVCNV